MKELFLFTWILFLLQGGIFAQYAPAAGEAGSTAIHKDSSIIQGWAISCEVERGFIQISDTAKEDGGSNRVSSGEAAFATGIANGYTVSLGDGGNAVLTFESPIHNGPGADFVVFENGLSSGTDPIQYFLELAFVEVSSNGTRFVRFPAVSLTQTSSQINGFGFLEPVNLYNLAGKYTKNYGTPFDLSDLVDSMEIDLDNITHVKVVDVTGSLIPNFASYDSKGNMINDPYPTPFASGGFDLDGVGVIHIDKPTVVNKENHLQNIFLFPNPAGKGQPFNVVGLKKNSTYHLYDLQGKTWSRGKLDLGMTIEAPVNTGIYIIEINTGDKTSRKKLLVTE